MTETRRWTWHPHPIATPERGRLSDGLSLRELIRDRTVVLLLSVEMFTTLGFAATATALGWQAYSRAHQPIVLGLLGLAEFIPAALLAIPAGHMADRRDRRRVAALGLLVVTVACVALALDAAAGDTEVWPLDILAFVSGVGNAYAGPAVGPLLAAGVSQRSLARAVAVLISVMQAGMIAGPAIAGLLQIVGSPVPYFFSGVCAAAAVVMVSLVPASVGRAHVGAHKATFSDALAGARFIFATPALLGAISLDLMAVLFGGGPRFCRSSRRRSCTWGRSATDCCGLRREFGAVVVGSGARADRCGGGWAERCWWWWRCSGCSRWCSALHQLRPVDGGPGGTGRRRCDLDVDPGHARAAAHAA